MHVEATSSRVRSLIIVWRRQPTCVSRQTSLIAPSEPRGGYDKPLRDCVGVVQPIFANSTTICSGAQR